MKTFLDEVNEKIDGVPIQRCYHCRKCTAGCPMAFVMEYNPNKVIKMIQMGKKDEVLGSSTIWLCASCYACTVECPQGIRITDIMYELKQRAIHEGVYPWRFPIPVLAREFYEIVRRRGRSSETWLVLRMAFRSNPFILLGMAKSGWALLRTGRLSFKSEGIRNPQDLQRELAVKREVV